MYFVRSKPPDFSLQISSRSRPEQLQVPRSTFEENPEFSVMSAFWILKERRFTPDKYTNQSLLL